MACSIVTDSRSGCSLSTRAPCQACRQRPHHFLAAVADSGESMHAPHSPPVSSRVVSSLQIVFLTDTLTYQSCNDSDIHNSLAVALPVFNPAICCPTSQLRHPFCATKAPGKRYRHFAFISVHRSLSPLKSVTNTTFRTYCTFLTLALSY